MKKTRSKKSGDTVPLIQEKIYSNIFRKFFSCLVGKIESGLVGCLNTPRSSYFKEASKARLKNEGLNLKTQFSCRVYCNFKTNSS